MKKLLLYSLGVHNPLASRIATELRTTATIIPIEHFKDGEQHLAFPSSVKGKTVVLIQSTHQPDTHLVSLLLATNAAHNSGAKRVLAVIPYLGYGRAHVTAPLKSNAALVVANLLQSSNIDAIVTVDLHSEDIGTFYKKGYLIHLSADRVLVPYLRSFFKKEIANEKLVVVAPDKGGTLRARTYAELLTRQPLRTYIKKTRSGPNTVAHMELTGSVRGKTALIVDDMIDTGGTIIRAATLLKKEGARAVYVTATHGIFSGNALRRLARAPIKKIIVTDTIPGTRKLVSTVSVAPVLADTLTHL